MSPGCRASGSSGPILTATACWFIPATGTRTTCTRRPGTPFERARSASSTTWLSNGSSRSVARSRRHRLTTYVNDVDPLVQVFDGFFVHARGGFTAPLHVDNDPPTAIPENPDRFRADRRVPIMSVHAETDVSFGGAAARQDDDETYVLWEIAGTSHADTYFSAVAAIDTGVLPIDELAAAWRPAAEFLGAPSTSPSTRVRSTT